jgi:DNA-binding response OmpR family regulator
VSAPRILIVDDDEALRRLLRMTFDQEYEIAEAESGRRGLELLDTFNPDLLVLDWTMPSRWGGELLDEVKRRYPALPVIVLTADHNPEHRQIAEHLGAGAFVTKPFSPIELVVAVERLLPGRSPEHGS